MLCYSGILQKHQHTVCWVKGMIWEKMCCMEMCVQVQACRHDYTVDINYKRLQKILKKTVAVSSSGQSYYDQRNGAITEFT